MPGLLKFRTSGFVASFNPKSIQLTSSASSQETIRHARCAGPSDQVPRFSFSIVRQLPYDSQSGKPSPHFDAARAFAPAKIGLCLRSQSQKNPASAFSPNRQAGMW